MIDSAEFLRRVPETQRESLRILALVVLIRGFNQDPGADSLHKLTMGLLLLKESASGGLLAALIYLREEACREEVLLINTEKLRTNAFRITSALSEYQSAFGPGLTEKLLSLGAAGRWMDGGAGQAKAQRGYLKEPGQLNQKAFCLAVSYQKPEDGELREDEKTLASRFLYLEGPFVSLGGLQFADASCDLITDVNGILYYSDDFNRDLRRYLTLLKIGGRLLFTEPGGVEFTDGTHGVKLATVLGNITGVTVTMLRQGYTCAYQIDKNAAIEMIPPMSCKEVEWKGQNSVRRVYEVTGLIDVEVKTIKL